MGDIQRKLVLEVQTRKQLEYELSKSSSVNEETKCIRQQLMNAQMHITNLEQMRVEDREVLNEKELEIARLNKRLGEAAAESDVVVALHAQVCIYFCKGMWESIF